LPFYFNQLSGGGIDGRIKAHTLDAFLLAEKIDAPSIGNSTGGIPGGNDWDALAHEGLNHILDSQREDGTYRSTWDGDLALDGSGAVVRPFMEGMVNHTLIDYYFSYEKDSRILDAVKENIDAVWNLTWSPTAQAFLYNSKATAMEPGSAVPAPDLNNMLVEGFGFVYAMTGDPVYKQRGDAVFAGGVNGAYLYGLKQFNQEYTASDNYLALTHPELTTTAGDHSSDWLL
jgi:hypothetical protein